MKIFVKIIPVILILSLNISIFAFANEEAQEPSISDVTQSSLQLATEDDNKENKIVHTKGTNGEAEIIIDGVSTIDLQQTLLEKIENMDNDHTVIYFYSLAEEYLYKASMYPESKRSKEELAEYVTDLFDLLVDELDNKSDVIFSKAENIANCDLWIGYYEGDESWKEISCKFYINDKAVKVETDFMGEMIVPVKDGNVFVEFFADATENSFTTFKTKLYNANTPNVKGDIEDFTHTDIVEFDFVLPEDSDNSLTKEVAKPGETVSAVVDQYRKNRRYVHVLTLSGSLGEVSFWTEYQNMQLEESLDLYSDNLPIVFNDQDRFENGNRGYYPVGKTKDSYPVQIRFNSGKLYSVTFAEDIECTNISHISLVEDSSMEDKYGDKDKEAMIEQLEKDMQNGAKEQDLERYVTEMRTFEEDGSEGFDFYIAFLAQADMDISASASTPDWYDNLGDNVKATIVGITQTWAGKDRRNYTMIKFSGDDDSIWFDMSMIIPSAAIDEKDCYVETIYSSLISFDGFQKIQNTIKYDTTSAVINFDNFENKKLTSVVFEIGKKKVEISADKIKHIGGGKIAYEKLW